VYECVVLKEKRIEKRNCNEEKQKTRKESEEKDKEEEEDENTEERVAIKFSRGLPRYKKSALREIENVKTIRPSSLSSSNPFFLSLPLGSSAPSSACSSSCSSPLLQSHSLSLSTSCVSSVSSSSSSPLIGWSDRVIGGSSPDQVKTPYVEVGLLDVEFARYRSLSVELKDSFVIGDHVALVFPLLGPSLLSYLEFNQHIAMPLDILRDLSWQMISAVAGLISSLCNLFFCCWLSIFVVLNGKDGVKKRSIDVV